MVKPMTRQGAFWVVLTVFVAMLAVFAAMPVPNTQAAILVLQ